MQDNRKILEIKNINTNESNTPKPVDIRRRIVFLFNPFKIQED